MENKNLLKKKISEYIFPKEIQKNYLEGKKGTYTIKRLYLNDYLDYHFNDGNNYIFEECTLTQAFLSLKNQYVAFKNCFFGGNVAIENKKTEYGSVIEFTGNYRREERYVDLEKLFISCSDISFDDCLLLKAKELNLTGNYLKIVDSKISPKEVRLNNFSFCIVENSSINNFDFENEVKSTYVEKSDINGFYYDLYEWGYSPELETYKESGKKAVL